MSRTDKLVLALATAVLVSVCLLVGWLHASSEDSALNAQDYNLAIDEATAENLVRRKSLPQRDLNEKTAAISTVKENKIIKIVVAAKGKIVGTVLDEAGSPIEGVKVVSKLFFPIGKHNYGLVSKHETETETDIKGRFGLEVPGHGFYRLILTHAVHAPVIKKEVKAGNDLEIIMKDGAALRGVVTSKNSGAEIKGAKLIARLKKGPWKAEAFTDKDGKYSFEGLFPAGVFVTISADDYLSIKDRPIELVAAKVTTGHFALDAGRAIKGMIINDKGSWIAHAKIKIHEREVKTDETGCFRFGGLAQESQRMIVVADGFLTHHQKVNLSGSRAEADIKITLNRGGTLTGLVLGDDGTPVIKAEIKVFQSWGSDSMWDTGQTRFVSTTDENGQFKITGLQKQGWSQYRARATKDGYAATFSERIKMEKNKVKKNITMIMRTGGKLAGHVRDESGNPIAGVKLTLNLHRVYEWTTQGRKSSQVVLSDDKGFFSFDKLAENKYRVAATAKGYATQYKNGMKVIGASVDESIEFSLKAGGVVKGTVKTDTDEVVKDATIYLYSNSSWGRAKTDENGEYTVTNVGEGPYYASARAKGYSREIKKKVFPIEGKIDFEVRRDGYVWGEVVKREDDEAVRRYRVQLQQQKNRGQTVDWTTKSSVWVNDPEGKFKIYAPDGTYRLVIKSKGHMRYEQNGVALSVDAEPEEMTIKVIPGGAIEGWVKDANDEAIPWTQIYLRKSSTGSEERWIRKGYTETDGYYFVDSLEAGSYEIGFARRSRLPLTINPSANVFGGELTRIDVAGRRSTKISVMFSTENDVQINWQHVTVKALSATPIYMKRMHRWRKGIFYTPHFEKSYYARRGQPLLINDLPPGLYELTASKSRYNVIKEEFQVTNNGNMDLDLVFKKKTKKKKKKTKTSSGEAPNR